MLRELVIIQDNKAVTTSLTVAENFERNHRDVLKSIETLKEGLAEKFADLFYESSYTHEQNKQEYKMYYMNRDGFVLLAMGFNGTKALHFKLKYIEEFNRMEELLKSQVQLPSYMIENPIQRAERWIEEQREKEALEHKIEEQKPLVTFAEKCIKTKDSILVRELAKVIQEQGINLGEKKLYKKLRDWGLILQGKTEPSQKGMNMELFEVVQRPFQTPYGETLTRTTKVTPKGQVFIVEKLQKEIDEDVKSSKLLQ